MDSITPPIGYVPLVFSRDTDSFNRWWDSFEFVGDVEDAVAALRADDNSDAVFALSDLMTTVLQLKAPAPVPGWIKVEGLRPGAEIAYVTLDFDPDYDGTGVLDGAKVVVNLHTANRIEGGSHWLAVSSYVSRPHREFRPDEGLTTREALAQIIDAALILINWEVARSDRFLVAARQMQTTS
ncbi:hypothetical protein [Mycobacteroides abscessus]|uniref:hypothetical protein n=1 Tax=Mycobacteroides abscessus TaxID=36809 RepID=UPI0009A8E363|nr:hypothetical protein [Mycobacteroides abscessus]SKU01052.1 Uncharacterised protein [Mycobacteroides abscessus subsp. massiliense]SKU20101.1 Uncharacterised protein [Mycobacteroides abscessus subsp. massiliense]